MPDSAGERVTLADALRRAVRDSGLSYNELRRRSGVNQAQVSRFMLGERDLTVQVASRLCLVLGYELVRTGEVLAGPLAEPPVSTRGRAEDAPPPESAYARGRGKRVDLEGAAPVETPRRKSRNHRAERVVPEDAGKMAAGRSGRGPARGEQEATSKKRRKQER